MIKKHKQTTDSRIAYYEHFTKVYAGEFEDIWGSDLNTEERKRYIPVNYGKKVAVFIKRLLLNNKPRFTVQDDDIQAYLESLLFDTDFIESLTEGVINAQILGETVLRTSYRPLHEDSMENMPVIEFIHPKHYHPVFSQWDSRRPKHNRLIFTSKDEQGTTYRREEVDSYNVWNERYLMKRKEDAEFILIKENEIRHDCGFLVQPVRIDALPGDFWGRSILEDIEQILRQVSFLTTQIAEVLRKHMKPKLALPASIFDSMSEEGQSRTDLEGNKYFYIGSKEIYRWDPQDDNGMKPEYIVWDAKLDVAMEFEKALRLTLSILSDMPMDVFKGSDTTQPASGTALKIARSVTIDRAQEIAQYFKKAIERALYQAQVLEIELGTKLNGKKAEWVQVDFIVDVPQDADEVRLEMDKLEKGVQSKGTTIQHINNWNIKQTDEELQRIKDESFEQVKPSNEDL